jgi:hypothetical protein
MANRGGHSGREGADDALALAMAQGQTLRQAATTAGVGYRTAARRWAKPEFRRRVNDLRDSMVAGAIGVLSSGMTKAANRLLQLVDSQNESVAASVSKAIIELPIRLREAIEVQAKVHELEALLVEAIRQRGDPVTRNGDGED